MRYKISYICKALLLILTSFIFIGCTTSPNEYFHKSANNRLLDSKGARGGKRQPLYNEKYILKAKRNIMEKEYGMVPEHNEMEHECEAQNIEQSNKQIYRTLVESELGKKKKKFRKKNKNQEEPKIIPNNQDLIDKHNKQIKEKDEKIDMLENTIAKLQKQLSDLQNELDNNKKLLVDCNALLDAHNKIHKQVNDNVKPIPCPEKDLPSKNLPATESNNKKGKCGIKRLNTKPAVKNI